jgi:hypothetical protein
MLTGKIRHTIRNSNGTGQPAFADANAQESNGATLKFSAAEASGVGSVGSVLQVVGIADK